MNFVRTMGLHLVKIKEIKKAEFRGNEKLVLVMEDRQGRLIDARFKLPLGEISQNQLNQIKRVCEIPHGKTSALKDKELMILVIPNQYNGKTYWQVGKFLSRHLESFIGVDGNNVDDVDVDFEPKKEIKKEDDLDDLPF